MSGAALSFAIALLLLMVFVSNEDNLIKVGLVADRLGVSPRAILASMVIVYMFLASPIGCLLQARAR
jgi:hypothetical protein